MGKVNVALADTLVQKDWGFIRGLKASVDEEWEISCWNNAGLMKNKFDTLKRYIGYFFHGFTTFCKRKKYDRIVAWQQFYGVFFAFFCRLVKVKKSNTLVIMTFIYKDKVGTIGKIYKKFISYAIESKYVDYCIVFSENEIAYYSKLFPKAKNKFKYLPLGIDSKIVEGNTELKFQTPFFLAAGRSNRDYDFLINTIANTKYNVVIISDSVKEYSECDNITVYDNIRGEEYLKILKECVAVLIPLESKKISSGQLVMLQAMQYGKPIIITESETLSGYVVHGFNALICRKQAEDFIEAMEMVLNDDETKKRLIINGRRQFDEKFSLYALGTNVGDLIK